VASARVGAHREPVGLGEALGGRSNEGAEPARGLELLGDACDPQTCGNGVTETPESCDGASAAACAGPCLSTCLCSCFTVDDPHLHLKAMTKNDKGSLTASFSVPLASFSPSEPVTIRLEDGDSTPIVQQVVTLAPVGRSGRLWQYKAPAKTLGLEKVKLIDRAPSRPGTFTVTVTAKRWFTAAAADQPAAGTLFTLRLGATRCFVHAVLSKVDSRRRTPASRLRHRMAAA
jgi:hypothetical protein